MLSVNDLTIHINKTLVVRNMSINIQKGQTYCLLGPNGAGKTTALRGIVGAIPITSGTIKIGSFDMHSTPLQAKRELGYIPDDGWLFRNVTGQQYLTFIGKLRGISNSQSQISIEHLSSQLRISDNLNQPIDELSRGSQQKIAMIAGLIHNPSLVIMDEPLTALDPLITREVIQSIKDLAARNVTFLIATHLLTFAEEVASHIGILVGGSLLSQGTIKEVKTYYDRYTLENVLEEAVLSDRH